MGQARTQLGEASVRRGQKFLASDLRTFLRDIRHAAGLTQVKLGLDLGLDNTAISKLEHQPLPYFEGRRGLVLAWATACGVGAVSVGLQRFLIATKNGPFVPPEMEEALAEVAAMLATKSPAFVAAPSPAAGLRMLLVAEKQLTELRSSHTTTEQDLA
jgi:hypothetical protein